MKKMPGKHNILNIYSNTENLQKVDLFLRGLLNEFVLPENLYNRFYLCVSEAVVNAIEHGNKSDKSKLVTIEAVLEDDFAKIKISDEGQGFDTTFLKDPTCTENIRKESGRGLFIIKNYTDDLQFKDKGNIIEFKIKLSGGHTISS